MEQVCIQVGCVPSAALAVRGGGPSIHLAGECVSRTPASTRQEGRGVCIPACTGQGVCIPACTEQGVSAWGCLPSACWDTHAPL